VIVPGAAVLLAAFGPAAAPVFSLHCADADLVRRVLAETGVVRKPPGPRLMAYFGAWGEAIGGWIAEFFAARPGLAGQIAAAVEIAAVAIVVAAGARLAVSLARRLARRSAPAPAPAPGWSQVPAQTSGRRDRLGWRQEIEASLERGDVAGALEALWWWLAASLLPEAAVDSSWTTRELLMKARRPELLGLGAMLDVLMYGRRAASAGDVTACLARLEERLA
jgi:hypothetical protein